MTNGASSREPKAWPAFTPEKRPLSALAPFERNARMHSDDQVEEIAQSITEWGWTMPILVDERDEIIAGHGRYLAAQLLQLTEVPVVVARGWTEPQRRAYRLADNKLSLNSTWDDKLLALEVKDLREMGFNMGLAGFNSSDLTSLDEILTEEEASELVQSNGSLLALVDIAIAEPRHVVLPGEVWKVGPHSLHVMSVLTGWASWAPELHGEAVVFCPYPSPFVPLSDKANDHRLVMVQPDPYICGHLLDRYTEVKGKRSVKRIKEAHQ